MKRATTIAVALISSIALITGCEDAAKTNPADQKENIVSKKEIANVKNQDTENKNTANAIESANKKIANNNKLKNKLKEDLSKYKGDWKLKVAGDEELYRVTSLEDYFGRTGIDIVDVNNNSVKGNIYSIQGAPSYRQTTVDFKGDIKDGKLTVSYEDENWLYAGTIKLTFKNGSIAANITRDKTENAPMWGIPEGEFTFIRPIETKAVSISDKDKNKLEQFLFPTAKDRLKPFKKGELTDNTIISFVGVNLGAGFLDAGEFGGKVKEAGAEIEFDKSVMNDLAKRYFGTSIKKHKSYDAVKYKNGTYAVPALGGVSESPLVQTLMKDTENEGTYYAVVDYISENPEKGKKPEYESFIELQKNKNNNYTIQAIEEIENPIDFEALSQIRE